MGSDQKLLLTVPECADRLGLGRSFMYELVQKGEIASLKLGRARRVAVTELERYVAKLQTEQASDGA